MRATTATRRRNEKTIEAPPGPRLFTVAEYLRMAEKGILKPGERVELIEGEIIRMAAMGDRHIGCIIVLTDGFGEHTRGRAAVSAQLPLRLTQHLEPEPDLMLLRPPSSRYREKAPATEDVLLVIEVSDTSLAYDRGRKLTLYAREGIPEVWIVNLRSKRIEVYREPSEGRYRETSIHERGSSVSPSAFPDLSLPVADVV